MMQNHYNHTLKKIDTSQGRIIINVHKHFKSYRPGPSKFDIKPSVIIRSREAFQVGVMTGKVGLIKVILPLVGLKMERVATFYY